MALEYAKVVDMATAVKEASETAVACLHIVERVLDANSALAIDWAAAETPAYITEGGNGNLSGLTYGRADVANAIGSLDQVRRLMRNLSLSQGNHVGNLHKLAKASN